MEEKKYDLIIIGAGPAGLTAAIYAGRYLLNTLIIGELNGGAISEAAEICNFPSHNSITGMELTKKLIEQVKNLGIKINSDKVEEIKINSSKLNFSNFSFEHEKPRELSKRKIKKNEEFEIKTDNSIYSAKKIIIAIGREKVKLNLENENKLLGRGISYCATCDATFFKEKIVSVIGGSNAALTAALLLSRYAKKVYIIYRQEKFFRAEPTWVKQVEKDKKIELIFNSEIKEIKGSEKVEGILLDSGKELSLDGIFVEIGSIPDTKIAKQLNLNLENNYIVVNKIQETSISGIFAAGDITNNPLKQAITACAEGAIASTSAYEQIKKQE